MRKPVLSGIGAASLIAVSPALAQDALAETPRGTYFIYGENDGAVFISYEPGVAEASRWPLTFFYYREGEFAGAARMAGISDCPAMTVRATLTDLLSEEGVASPPPSGEAMPLFTFEQSNGGGGEAITRFVCGTASARLEIASAPIHGTPASTVHKYVGLRGLGLGERLARDLAIRDPANVGALVNSTVAEETRSAAMAILTETP